MESGHPINFLVGDRRCYLTRFVLSKCLLMACNELNPAAIGRIWSVGRVCGVATRKAFGPTSESFRRSSAELGSTPSGML